jgi:Domain of unknown function (DUF4345)
MNARAVVRRVALIVSGLTLIVIAAIAIPFPRLVAAHYAVSLADRASYSEFRAVFVGAWIGIGAVMLVAARRRDLPILGDLCGALVLCIAGGRALGFVLDGTLEGRFVLAFAAELASGLAIVLSGPGRAASRSASSG